MVNQEMKPFAPKNRKKFSFDMAPNTWFTQLNVFKWIITVALDNKLPHFLNINIFH